MRKIWIVAAAWLLLGAVVALAALNSRPATANDADSSAGLPIVLKPEGTPTPMPNVGCPPRPTPTAAAYGLVNGGFEGCWNTIEQGNQEPHGWELTWIPIGGQLWDSEHREPASAIAEMVHKLKLQLPQDEWPGAPNALILDGEATYKIFSKYNVFGSQLRQQVFLPAGSWRLVVPMQIHWHAKDPNNIDPYEAESSVWVIANGKKSGAWVNALEMGDRKWYYHEVEFDLPEDATVEVLIRVKSVYRLTKDFFIDAVRIEPVDSGE